MQERNYYANSNAKDNAMVQLVSRALDLARRDIVKFGFLRDSVILGASERDSVTIRTISSGAELAALLDSLSVVFAHLQIDKCVFSNAGVIQNCDLPGVMVFKSSRQRPFLFSQYEIECRPDPPKYEGVGFRNVGDQKIGGNVPGNLFFPRSISIDSAIEHIHFCMCKRDRYSFDGLEPLLTGRPHRKNGRRL